MEVLRQGSDGPAVRRWQSFLLGQAVLKASGVDGIYGPATKQGTVAFQKKAKITSDGLVGPETYAAALLRGFDPGFVDPHGGTAGPDWPPKPAFAPLISNTERAAVFGKFDYSRVPGKDAIEILGGWAAKNIVPIVIPELHGVEGAPKSGKIWMHRLVGAQTQALFAEWGRQGVASLLLSWAGSFVPRFVRGSSTTLSNHAWGTAFDVNAAWNGLGRMPPLRGEKGSVRELIPAANQFGFYWDGHFNGRRDGMHFEVARVLG
jgi:hypothetical protein